MHAVVSASVQGRGGLPIASGGSHSSSASLTGHPGVSSLPVSRDHGSTASYNFTATELSCRTISHSFTNNEVVNGIIIIYIIIIE